VLITGIGTSFLETVFVLLCNIKLQLVFFDSVVDPNDRIPVFIYNQSLIHFIGFISVFVSYTDLDSVNTPVPVPYIGTHSHSED
jgi:hypothetical protein